MYPWKYIIGVLNESIHLGVHTPVKNRISFYITIDNHVEFKSRSPTEPIYLGLRRGFPRPTALSKTYQLSITSQTAATQLCRRRLDLI